MGVTTTVVALDAGLEQQFDLALAEFSALETAP